jgi:hypothetical protein
VQSRAREAGRANAVWSKRSMGSKCSLEQGEQVQASRERESKRRKSRQSKECGGEGLRTQGKEEPMEWKGMGGKTLAC